MNPEEGAEQDGVGSCSQSTEYWIEPQPHEGPGRAVACCVLKALNECQGEQHRKNQAQDNVAIPRPVQKALQLLGTKERSPVRKEEQGKRDQEDKNIQDGRKDVAIANHR